jgi:hypothetical protein
MRRLLLVLALVAAPAQAGETVPELVPVPASPVGHLYAPDAFVPTRLPHIGDLDRLIAEFDLLDGEKVGVRRENFGADPTPEWLVVAPERRCAPSACEYALFDGATAREIGRFYGTLLVLDRQHNGYPVIQTINRQDEGFSSLRTYLFSEKTYQVDDDALIGEAARQAIEASFAVRH